MRRVCSLFAGAAAMALGASLAAQSVPEIAFDANADLLKLPENIHLGEAAGVATNSKGHIFVYTRTGASHATVGTSRTFYKAGSRLLDDLIARARVEGASGLHAGDVFELHDTHGFPVELTAELAREAAEAPQTIKEAPHDRPVQRLDEVRAARSPVVRYSFSGEQDPAQVTA